MAASGQSIIEVDLPRYFFHLAMDGQEQPDTIEAESPDDASALREAGTALTEVMRDDLQLGKRQAAATIRVQRTDGTRVVSLKITLEIIE